MSVVPGDGVLGILAQLGVAMRYWHNASTLRQITIADL
jgi:hypothetical protein